MSEINYELKITYDNGSPKAKYQNPTNNGENNFELIP